ncbi:MAG: hypothetical protein ACXVA4_11805, partial [Ktedonobacterales bacterium]
SLSHHTTRTTLERNTKHMSIRWQRFRYELRLLGAGAFLLPLAIVAIYTGFSLIVRSSTLGSGDGVTQADFQMARGLLALMENGLPLAAGLIAAAAVNQDVAVELHLSLPAPYRRTVAGRLAVVALWALLLTALVSALLLATHHWIVPVEQPLSQLTWLVPLLWYIAAGALLTLLLRSRVASSTALGMIWIAQFLFKPVFQEYGVLQRLYLFITEQLIPDIWPASYPSWYTTWLQNRLTLLALALLMLGAVALLLRRNEALLGAEA